MRESGAALDALRLEKVLAGPPSGLSEIQAEDYVDRHVGLTHQWWIIDQEIAGAGAISGGTGVEGSYLQALTLGGEDSLIAHAFGPESPYLEFNFLVDEPGEYDLKVRAAGIGPSSNSLWVEILTRAPSDPQGNEVTESSLHVDTGRDLTFDLHNAGRWLLDAGVVTVRISMRESGTALDAVRLSRAP
jgi:hypothetical protein